MVSWKWTTQKWKWRSPTLFPRYHKARIDAPKLMASVFLTLALLPINLSVFSVVPTSKCIPAFRWKYMSCSSSIKTSLHWWNRSKPDHKTKRILGLLPQRSNREIFRSQTCSGERSQIPMKRLYPVCFSKQLSLQKSQRIYRKLVTISMLRLNGKEATQWHLVYFILNLI